MGKQDGINEEQVQEDIAALSHELTYHKYLLNDGQVRTFFKNLSLPEYLALHIVEDTERENGNDSGKTYLKDIADKLQRTIHEISKMAKALQDRGLVVWSHDGDGSEGTYVTITESGRKMLTEEKEVLKNYYGRVIKSYGRDNLVQLLQLMKQLETVMNAEIEGTTDTQAQLQETIKTDA